VNKVPINGVDTSLNYQIEGMDNPMDTSVNNQPEGVRTEKPQMETINNSIETPFSPGKMSSIGGRTDNH